MIRLSSVFKNSLIFNQQFAYGVKKPYRPKNAHQRIKQCAKSPILKLKTLIRPPDLTEPNITFPIKIPIRYRHVLSVKKQLFLDNSSKIHWQRLQPNQILLGFQNLQYLTFNQIVEGLEYLSKVPTQQQHNWNEHEWVCQAMNTIRDKFNHIKKKQIMKFYWLMKKLRYTDEQFWKKMYAKIEENAYDLYETDFQYFFMEYYDRFEEVFSPNARQNFHKLMENQIRQYKPSSILKIFEIYHKEGKLNNYWLQNVFISLFKHQQYHYNAQQIGKILRYMMILQHEENQRLYSNIYSRIDNLEFNTEQEIQNLVEVLQEVREIFASHRVESNLELLQEKKKKLKDKKTQTKLTLQQMVKNDLKYFLEKRKLKEENAQAEY